MPVQLKLFVTLFLGFVAATIIGTLSHEAGHWAVSEALGHDARIAYTYTDYAKPYRPISEAESFIITLGGPLQTAVTGTFGLLLLWRRRKEVRFAGALSTKHWLYVFLALFWLREPTNAVVWLAKGWLGGHWSARMDEVRAADGFRLPSWAVIIPAAMIG